MSRWSSGEPAQDQGFSLVEVLVAIGILLVVMVALLPQLVVGIRAGDAGRTVTQAKGAVQGQLESMRNLPFYVAPAAGTYLDLLDSYYPDDVAPVAAPACGSGPPAATSVGYVPAGAARCAYEPSGAFYRTLVDVPPVNGLGAFTLVVATQFLSADTPPAPVAPVSGYDSSAEGSATPPASQVGVTVTAFASAGRQSNPVSSRTQITRRDPADVRVSAEASVTAVQVGSATNTDGPLTVSAGLVNLRGSLAQASDVGASVAAVDASASTGAQGSGAAVTAGAPPAFTQGTIAAAAGELFPTTGCDFVCWGGTRIGAVSLTADDGLPRAGGPTAPLWASVPTGASNDGFALGNGTTDAGLDLLPPLVRLDADAGTAIPAGYDCGVGASPSPSTLTGGGYLYSTGPVDPDPLAVDVCATAAVGTVELLATTGAPDGLIQVALTGAGARCTVSGSAHTATTAWDYSAVVRYWDGSAYVTAATVTPGALADPDPLDAVPLTTSVGGGRTLGDYIESWSSLTTAEVTDSSAPGRAEVSLPGVVTVTSKPVRAAEPDSAVSLTVGALGCRAEDAR